MLMEPTKNPANKDDNIFSKWLESVRKDIVFLNTLSISPVLTCSECVVLMSRASTWFEYRWVDRFDWKE